jgi:hypothetical protein
VTPGQLPTRSRELVSALNNVVFPQLGFPAKAMVNCFIFSQSEPRDDKAENRRCENKV